MSDTTLHAPDFLAPGDTVTVTPRTYTVSDDRTVTVLENDGDADLDRLRDHGFTDTPHALETPRPAVAEEEAPGVEVATEESLAI